MAKSSIILCFVLFALVLATASATYLYGGYGYAPAYGYAVAYRPAVVGYAYPSYGYYGYGGLYGGYYLRKWKWHMHTKPTNLQMFYLS